MILGIYIFLVLFSFTCIYFYNKVENAVFRVSLRSALFLSSLGVIVPILILLYIVVLVIDKIYNMESLKDANDRFILFMVSLKNKFESSDTTKLKV